MARKRTHNQKRGGAPHFSLSKLQLYDGEIVYDIGAGTGSVSVEMALQIPNGTVYAIERNPEAVTLLHANRDQFHLHNLEIISGNAPPAFSSLPAPDRAFIGGTGSGVRKILMALLHKNPKIRIVLNAITLETLSDSLQALQKLNFQNIDVVQLSVAKAKPVGGYHMMMGQNPIYILEWARLEQGENFMQNLLVFCWAQCPAILEKPPSPARFCRR